MIVSQQEAPTGNWPKVPKRVTVICMLGYLFFNQFLWFLFSMFLTIFLLCYIQTDCVWLLLFSRYKGNNIWSLYFRCDWDIFFLWIPYEISYLYFSVRFDQALMISKLKRIKGNQKEPMPKNLFILNQICRWFFHWIPQQQKIPMWSLPTYMLNRIYHF